MAAKNIQIEFAFVQNTNLTLRLDAQMLLCGGQTSLKAINAANIEIWRNLENTRLAS